MTRSDTEELLAVLKAAYPNFYKDTDGDALQLVIEVWATALADCEADCIRRGAGKLIRGSKWPPTIAEVISAGKDYDPRNNLVFATAARLNIADGWEEC